MPLNPFASEWVPPKVQTSVPASKSKDIASRARHVPRTSAQGSNPLDLVALSPRDRPAAAPAAGDDELNFEDGFDHDSAPSTPSTSVRGVGVVQQLGLEGFGGGGEGRLGCLQAPVEHPFQWDKSTLHRGPSVGAAVSLAGSCDATVGGPTERQPPLV